MPYREGCIRYQCAPLCFFVRREITGCHRSGYEFGGAEFFISAFILREFSEKLKGKFRIPSAEISRYTELLDTVFRKVTPSNEVPTACDDEDDNEILRLTEFVHADYLITGDKDLLKLNTFLQTKILSPAEFSKVVSHSL